MSTGLIVIIIVVGLLAGALFSLRSSARTGMPSKEVLSRASEHSRELDAQDKAEEDKGKT